MCYNLKQMFAFCILICYNYNKYHIDKKGLIFLKKLSASQQSILNYIKEKSGGGVPPTVREICSATGLKSTSTVHAHLKTLEKLGYIVRNQGHRSIQLSESEENSLVPILGNVTAGLPILAFEDIQGYVPFPSTNKTDKTLFALNIMGESMRDIGILDGDIVICEKTSYAENGDIVVALIEDEATVKSFYKEDGHYRLQPHNPDFEPIIVDKLEILGKVISLTRNY